MTQQLAAREVDSRSAEQVPTIPRRPGRRGAYITGAIAYLITFVVLLPLLWVAILSFEPNQHILTSPFDLSGLTTSNYFSAVRTLHFLTMYKNTLIIAVVSVPVGLIVSYMAAFALTRMVLRHRRRRLQTAIRFYFVAGLAVPVYVILFPVYRLDVQLHLFGTYAALIVPYVATSIPFNILLFTGFLMEFPDEIEQSAVVDGCSLFALSWRVVFPLMRPVVATLGILNLIYVWNEFPFAVTLINDSSMTTVSLGVSQFQGQFSADYGAMMASAILVLVPQLIVFAIFQRQVISGMTAGAVR